MRRVHTPEIMDQPGVDRAELASALGFLRLVNRRLAGVHSLLKHLERWSVRWPAGRPVTLLDVATGSADVPVAAVRWARRRGFDLRVTGVDLHETTLELAGEYLRTCPDVADAITLRRADALALDALFAPRSFDYAHAGLFLHHLPDPLVPKALAQLDLAARAGLVWNDLIRSRRNYLAAHVLTLGRPRILRHDATVSVRAGFTKGEVLAIAEQLGLDFLRFERDVLAQRFTLAGERPGAWTTPG